MASPKAVTSADMRLAVRERWGASAAIFDEVGDSTGARGERRRADCVAMGLWPSRGLYLEGIEIKVSRPDWLAELRTPEKADAIGKFCDFWWIAVANDSIVKDGELPGGWGLLVLSGKTLKVVKKAPQLTPEPLDKGFVAALLRRAAEAQNALVAEARRLGREQGIAEGPPKPYEPAEHELARLKESLAEFEAKSGLRITGYDGPMLGEAVAKLRKLNGWQARRQDVAAIFERGADQLEHQAKLLRNEGRAVARELKLAAGVPLEQVEAEEREAANG